MKRSHPTELNVGIKRGSLDNLFSVEPERHPPVCVRVCPPSLPLSSPLSLPTHTQGRSFSISAHTPPGQHLLESADTELIEQTEGSPRPERSQEDPTTQSPVPGPQEAAEALQLTRARGRRSGCEGFDLVFFFFFSLSPQTVLARVLARKEGGGRVVGLHP